MYPIRFTARLFVLLIMVSWLGAQERFNIQISAPVSGDSLIAPLLGVISGPDPNVGFPNLPTLTSEFQDIGVVFIRNNDYFDDRLDMERMFRGADTSTYPSWDCDPEDTSNYHFEGSDEQFKSYIDGGFTPFFRLGGEYANEEREHDFKGPRTFDEETNWIKAAIYVTEHYNSFNGGHNLLQYLNIWTEFPGKHFWTQTGTAFNHFWARAYDSLKTHFPQMKIGGPGFNPAATTEVIEEQANGSAEQFLTVLYNHGLKPDWIGWHLWNNDPKYYQTAAKNMSCLLAGEIPFDSVPWAGSGFFNDVEMYVDAYGTSAQYLNDDGVLVEVSHIQRDSLYNKGKGASILTGQWIAMQYAGIKNACYYRGTDLGASNPAADPNDPNSNIGSQGLFYGDATATYKPTAQAFRLWSQVYQNFPKRLKTDVPATNSDGEELWTLAATDHNKYAVLISNIRSDRKEFTLEIEGQAVNSDNFSSIEVYQVDDRSDGRSVRNLTNSVFRIDGYRVQLYVLTPKTVGIQETQNTRPISFKASLSRATAQGDYRLALSLTRRSRTQVIIYNIVGQKIRIAFDQNLAQGRHQIPLVLKDLPSGVYLGLLKTHFGNKGFRFVVTH